MNYHNAMHNWLRLESGQSLGTMWGKLERLRRLKLPYDDLPADRVTFHAELEALLADGLAEKSGELWLFVPVKRPERERLEPPPKESKPQMELFA